jgi:hypothetical protein
VAGELLAQDARPPRGVRDRLARLGRDGRCRFAVEARAQDRVDGERPALADRRRLADRAEIDALDEADGEDELGDEPAHGVPGERDVRTFLRQLLEEALRERGGRLLRDLALRRALREQGGRRVDHAAGRREAHRECASDDRERPR